MNEIEIFALILLVVAIIKIILILYKPEIWFGLIERMYVIPQLITLLALISSAVVLYFLINAGLTIIEILAVCLFIALLLMIAIASYSEELFVWIKQQDMTDVVRRTWLYIFVWILLLGWGTKEIIFG